jgi:NB-ARC domain
MGVKIARDIVDTFSVVLDTLEQITNVLPVIETYTNLYSASSIQLLRDPLTNLYSDMIEFSLSAIRLYDRSTIRTLGRAAWSSLEKDFKNLLKNMDTHSKELDRAAEAEHMNETSEFRDEQRIANGQRGDFEREMRYRFAALLNPSSAASAPPSYNDAPLDLLSAYFTGRDEEIRKIRDAFSTSNGSRSLRCAIHGMYGVGKTQILLTYAQAEFNAGNYCYIFWISGASVEKLNQGVNRLLEILCLPERHEPEQSSKVLAAKSWLEKGDTSDSKRWLLVLDNADKEIIDSIREFLPRSNARGDILLSTRTEGMAEAMATTGGKRHLYFEIQVPSPEDAAKLLFRVSELDSDRSDPMSMKQAVKLIKSVGCLPLAVDQAGGFLKNTGQSLASVTKLYGSERRREVNTAYL